MLIYFLIIFAVGAITVKYRFVTCDCKTALVRQTLIELFVVGELEFVHKFTASETANVMVRRHIAVESVGGVGYRNTPYFADLGETVEIAVDCAKA